MDATFLQELLGESIATAIPLRGGDIAKAYKVLTPSNSYFVKTASYANALQMFEAEAMGLQYIRDTKTIAAPKVSHISFSNATAYLIMDFVPSKAPNDKDMTRLGEALARLHNATSANGFGLTTDNYIGSLTQSNTKHPNWADFYIHERIFPQLQMAVEAGLFPSSRIPELKKMKSVCNAFFGTIKPSLLHGDLWSGNYLISEQGMPYLIDPAVCYGHSEMDLAMTKLFGGFSSSFYNAYHEHIPPHPNQRELTELYQFYYLLVHLNLFGSSYFSGVQRIVQKYFL
ncbi:MAG: fructosamine kinase family protein [Bacteroidota bacterium]